MKKFKGSLLILIILIILCWPAGLVYFFIKYEEEPEAPTRTCMNCGANIAINYAVCPYCGKPATAPQYPNAANGQPGQPSNFSGKKCPSCGYPVNDGDKYCQTCGKEQI